LRDAICTRRLSLIAYASNNYIQKGPPLPFYPIQPIRSIRPIDATRPTHAIHNIRPIRDLPRKGGGKDERIVQE
jgi:hypothetical protein